MARHQVAQPKNALQTMGDELQTLLSGMCGTMCGQNGRGDKMRSGSRNVEDSLQREDTSIIVDLLRDIRRPPGGQRKSVDDDDYMYSS
eukprot:7387815-Prymnesium_polylepis.1